MIPESLKPVQHYVKAEQEEHRGTISGAAGRPRRYFLSFRLGKCFIICSKCYCSIIYMRKLSINQMPGPVHENWEKNVKISSPLLYSLESSAFLHATGWPAQQRETLKMSRKVPAALCQRGRRGVNATPEVHRRWVSNWENHRLPMPLPGRVAWKSTVSRAKRRGK